MSRTDVERKTCADCKPHSNHTRECTEMRDGWEVCVQPWTVDLCPLHASVAQLQQERDSARQQLQTQEDLFGEKIDKLTEERDSARAEVETANRRYENLWNDAQVKQRMNLECTRERDERIDRLVAVNRRLVEAGKDADRLLDVVLAFGEGFCGTDMPSVNKIQQKLKSALAGLEETK